MNDLVFIMPNGRIADTISRVVARRGDSFPVYDAYREHALEIARREIGRGAKVLVSLGVTAEYLKANLDTPVIKILYSEFEFITAIREGLTYSDKVAVVGSSDITYLTGRLLQVFQHKIAIFELNAIEPIELQARRILARGYEVIISGTPSVQEAINHGKVGIMPDIDERIIEFNIDNALYILRLLQETREKYETIDAILRCTSEGLVGTDAGDRIILVNPTAERIMGDRAEALYGEPFTAALRDRGIADILSQPPNGGEAVQKRIVITSLPVVVESSEVGRVYAVKEVEEIQALEQRIRKELLIKGHFARHSFVDIVGGSRVLGQVKDTAKKFARYDSTVLISGETGTGKELFAQSIHNDSGRAREAFVAVNCAALPENLLESELFGYVKGAFTGARRDGKMGLFEMAHGGTLFLDEISEMPMSMQSRFLRVLQERQVSRIGDDKLIPVDVRVISATNRNLPDMVAAGTFREDLYYRLCILELRLPPLREHPEDIPDIVRAILARKCRALGRGAAAVTDGLMVRLAGMSWPGNVRQLDNMVERMLVMAESDTLDEALLDQVLQVSPTPGATPCADPDPHSREREAILEALRRTGGNKTAAAGLLGIHPTTLWRKMKRLDM